jgi:protein LTV1
VFKVDRDYSDEEEEEVDDDGDDDEAPPLITTRDDFENIMDDFLDKYEILGGKMRQILPGSTNVDKLGTIRHALTEDGPVVYDEDESDEANDVVEDLMVEEDKHDRWDCETILSMCLLVISRQPD